MTIKVYDLGGERCRETLKVVCSVAAQFGIEVEVITGVNAMLADGIGVAPTVVVERAVKCSGSVPEEEEVQAWLLPRNSSARVR